VGWGRRGTAGSSGGRARQGRAVREGEAPQLLRLLRRPRLRGRQRRTGAQGLLGGRRLASTALGPAMHRGGVEDGEGPRRGQHGSGAARSTGGDPGRGFHGALPVRRPPPAAVDDGDPIPPAARCCCCGRSPAAARERGFSGAAAAAAAVRAASEARGWQLSGPVARYKRQTRVAWVRARGSAAARLLGCGGRRRRGASSACSSSACTAAAWPICPGHVQRGAASLQGRGGGGGVAPHTGSHSPIPCPASSPCLSPPG